MQSYVNQTWQSPKDRKQYYFINRFNLEHTQIILYQTRPIGRISLTEKEKEIVIDAIHILPEYQGMGIGGGLIKGILTQAEKQQCIVKLILLKTNPAKHLYERLGFGTNHEDGERFYMCKVATSSLSSIL
jgi:ribosomal protein S18 acetylase RimI-like enzyme